MSAATVPAATLLRQLPGRRLVAGRSDVVHVFASTARARCGWGLPVDARLVDDVDEAPPVRVCPRCVTSLPPAELSQLRPDVYELAAVHAQQARAAAQACIDTIEAVRVRARADGSATVLTSLVKAAPAAAALRGPRPETRAERGRQRGGHVAVEETLTLAALLARLQPGGFDPHTRLYLVDPPHPGTSVDPQARR